MELFLAAGCMGIYRRMIAEEEEQMKKRGASALRFCFGNFLLFGLGYGMIGMLAAGGATCRRAVL